MTTSTPSCSFSGYFRPASKTKIDPSISAIYIFFPFSRTPPSVVKLILPHFSSESLVYLDYRVTCPFILKALLLAESFPTIIPFFDDFQNEDLFSKELVAQLFPSFYSFSIKSHRFLCTVPSAIISWSLTVCLRFW